MSAVSINTECIPKLIQLCKQSINEVNNTIKKLDNSNNSASAEWKDSKYKEFQTIIVNCKQSLMLTSKELGRCEKYLNNLLQITIEYNNINIGNNVSALKNSALDEGNETVSLRNNDSIFTYSLRGEKITLNGVFLKKISYVKRSDGERQQLRNEFNSKKRKEFLKQLGLNESLLREAGFSKLDIIKIQNGRVPDGWQVHHILPLDDSGTNEYNNLVLIQNEPHHMVITNYQNNMISSLNSGDSQTILWPIINNRIYPIYH